MLFWIWLRPRYKIPEFFTIAPVLTSTLTVYCRNRGDPSSLLRGDFNQLNDRLIVGYPLKQIVTLATRRANILDKIYTDLSEWYESPSILPPVGASDHNTVLVRAIELWGALSSGGVLSS